jgi:hypothetical protein
MVLIMAQFCRLTSEIRSSFVYNIMQSPDAKDGVGTKFAKN